jgi:hypothetical protein
MRRYVFVSHANEDKPKLRPLVEALLDAGIPLWIDRPEEFGLGERHLRCGRIVVGADWQQEIRHALENACCVLFILSEASNSNKRSDELFREFEHGKARDVLVMAQVDAIDPAELNPFFRIRQVVNLAASASPTTTKLEVLIERLRDHLQADSRSMALRTTPASASVAVGAAPADRRLQPRLLPYLTDRHDQQRQITYLLQQQIEAKSIRPTTFFVIGREDECVDAFVEQLRYIRLPAFLSANGLADDVSFKLLHWPGVDAVMAPRSDQEAEAQFLDIRAQVHGALGVAITSGAAALERRLATASSCYCFHINIALDHWGPGQKALLGRWLAWWSAMELRAATRPTVSVVSIVYTGGGWGSFGRVRGLSALRRDVGALQANPAYRGVAHVLRELASVRFEDVEHWIREHVETIDREDLRRRLARHFSGFLSSGRKQLPMYQAAAAMKAELAGAET